MELLMAIAVILLLVYVGGPVAIRLLVSQTAQPEFREVRREELPPWLAATFEQTAKELHALGFSRIATAAHVQDQVAGMMELHVDRVGGRMATANAVFRRGAQGGAAETAAQYVEFCTKFSEGGEVCTNNSRTLAVLGGVPPKEIFQLPAEHDLARLLEFHGAAVDRLFPGRTPVLPTPGEELAALSAGMIGDLDQYVGRGMMYLDQAGAAYRLTWKGAFLAAWRSLPAGSFLWRRRMEHRVSELMRARLQAL
jgi:hypothetical protein